MADVVTSDTTLDTHGMVVIHRAFRRESRVLGELVAAVPDGDTGRAAVLGRHLTWYEAGLSNHHRGEDDLIWPLLRMRVDEEIVARMERQHVRVAHTLAVVLGVLPAWEASAASKARDELVRALSDHRRVLLEHLDDEEDRLLPLAARHLTGPEWAALGDHFVATTPKAELLTFLGAVLEEATAEERAALLGAMPVLPRLAWWSIGRRRYASHMRKVRGTPAHQPRPQVATNLTEA